MLKAMRNTLFARSASSAHGCCSHIRTSPPSQRPLYHGRNVRNRASLSQAATEVGKRTARRLAPTATEAIMYAIFLITNVYTSGHYQDTGSNENSSNYKTDDCAFYESLGFSDLLLVISCSGI